MFCAVTVQGQLAVTVSPPKVTGQKAVVQMAMKNNFKQSIESARAMCFLIDEHGKMVGQSAKWVIGQNKAGLEPSATDTFNFVITSRDRPFIATNLTAKISFSRVILSEGKLANPRDEVIIEQPANQSNNNENKRIKQIPQSK